MRARARSRLRPRLTTSASRIRSSCRITLTLPSRRPPATTWWFVSTRPSALQITPAPAPRPRLCTCTTLLWARSTMRAPADEIPSAEAAPRPVSPRASSHPLAALADRYLKRLEFAPTNHLDRDLLPDPVASQEHQQVFGILHRLAVERRQDVAHYEATAIGGAAVLDPNHQETAPLREAPTLPVWQSHRLAQDPQVAALDGTSLLERLRDAPGEPCRDHEHRAPHRPCRHDPEYVPPGVDERTSREAGVRCGVGLDVALEPRSAPRARRAADGWSS